MKGKKLKKGKAVAQPAEKNEKFGEVLSTAERASSVSKVDNTLTKSTGRQGTSMIILLLTCAWGALMPGSLWGLARFWGEVAAACLLAKAAVAAKDNFLGSSETPEPNATEVKSQQAASGSSDLSRPTTTEKVSTSMAWPEKVALLLGLPVAAVYIAREHCFPRVMAGILALVVAAMVLLIPHGVRQRVGDVEAGIPGSKQEGSLQQSKKAGAATATQQEASLQQSKKAGAATATQQEGSTTAPVQLAAQTKPPAPLPPKPQQQPEAALDTCQLTKAVVELQAQLQQTNTNLATTNAELKTTKATLDKTKREQTANIQRLRKSQHRTTPYLAAAMNAAIRFLLDKDIRICRYEVLQERMPEENTKEPKWDRTLKDPVVRRKLVEETELLESDLHLMMFTDGYRKTQSNSVHDFPEHAVAVAVEQSSLEREALRRYYKLAYDGRSSEIVAEAYFSQQEQADADADAKQSRAIDVEVQGEAAAEAELAAGAGGHLGSSS